MADINSKRNQNGFSLIELRVLLLSFAVRVSDLSMRALFPWGWRVNADGGFGNLKFIVAPVGCGRNIQL